jgi:hypothetical protein
VGYKREGPAPPGAKERSVKRERKRIAENGQSFSTCLNLNVAPMANAFFGFLVF